MTYGRLSGSGVGMIYGVPMTLVTRWFPEKKGLAVGLVLVGFGLSPIITAPLARTLVENLGLMNTFLALGIAFAFIIPVLSIFLRYPSISEQQSLEKPKYANENTYNINTKAMLKSRNFIGLYANFLIGTSIGLMLIGLTSSVGADLIDLPVRTISFLVAIFAIFNGLGRPILGWIADRFEPKKTILLLYGLVLFAAILMLFAKQNRLVIYTLSFSIFWFTFGGWLAVAPSSTIKLFGTLHYSQNYGLVFTAYGFGAIIGVLSSGILLDIHGNYHYLFYLIILLCFIGLLITSFSFKEKN